MEELEEPGGQVAQEGDGEYGPDELAPLETGPRQDDLDRAARLADLALHPEWSRGLLAGVLAGTQPLLERRVHPVRVAYRLVVRGGVHQGEFQEFGDRRGLLARLAVLRGAGQREIRAAGLARRRTGNRSAESESPAANRRSTAS